MQYERLSLNIILAVKYSINHNLIKENIYHVYR